VQHTDIVKRTMSRRTLVANAVAPCCMPVFNLTTEMLKVNISSTTNMNPITNSCAICMESILPNAEGRSKIRKTSQKRDPPNEPAEEESKTMPVQEPLTKRILIDSCPIQGHWFHAECAWKHVQTKTVSKQTITCPLSCSTWSKDLIHRLCVDAEAHKNEWQAVGRGTIEDAVASVRLWIAEPPPIVEEQALFDVIDDLVTRTMEQDPIDGEQAILGDLALEEIEQDRIVVTDRLNELIQRLPLDLGWLPALGALGPGEKLQLLNFLLRRGPTEQRQLTTIDIEDDDEKATAVARLEAFIAEIPNLSLRQLSQEQSQSLVSFLLPTPLEQDDIIRQVEQATFENDKRQVMRRLDELTTATPENSSTDLTQVILNQLTDEEKSNLLSLLLVHRPPLSTVNLNDDQDQLTDMAIYVTLLRLEAFITEIPSNLSLRQLRQEQRQRLVSSLLPHPPYS
jgi:hypothetical protein